MTTPQFILDARKKIGHDPLWLSGITAYVEDEAGRILLGKRSDTGQWALVYGIIEPGEEPARAAAREVLEETGVIVRPRYLASVKSSPQLITYANGDQCRYLDLLFVCEVEAGGPASAHVGDDESTAVGWFSPDELPEPLASSTVERLETVREFKRRLAEGNAAALFEL